MAQLQSTPANAARSYSFEVASIKQNKSGDDRIALTYTPDGFIAVNVTVRSLVRFAYGPIEDTRIIGGSDWISSERFDVEARVESSLVDQLQKLNPPALRLERQRMLQSLLAERFGLTVHHESKERPVYALLIAKNGPRLHESRPGDTYPNGFKGADGRGAAGLYGGSGGQLIGQSATIPTLATNLSQRLGRIVLDETGLKGNYDFTLTWSPEQAPVAATDASDDHEASAQSSNPPLFEAIQQQLGLKLESQKALVDVLIIDHVDRPSGN